MSIDTQEILDKVNAKIAEIQARIGSIGSTDQNGTSGRDFLIANRFNDTVIDGQGGNDRIFGGFGNDDLLGGDGEDLIDSGIGDDFIDGGNGDDRIFGKGGNDILEGGEGDDLVDGSIGDDQVLGSGGDDTLNGGPGSDILLGGRGADILTGAGGNQTGGDPQEDILIGGILDDNGNAVPDGAPDQFVLGNSDGAFYTAAGDTDLAFILDFELGVDGLDLSPAVSHGLLFNSGDTDIFALPSGGAPELIASVIGVDLTQGQGVVVI